MMYLKQSNQELATQVEKLSKRSHLDQAKVATTERAVLQLEAQNVWLEAQLKAAIHENTGKTQQNQQQSPHTVVLFRETTSAPPQLQTEDLSQTIATTTAEMEIPGNSLSLSLTLSGDSSLAGMQLEQQQQACDENRKAANRGDGGNDDKLNDTDIDDGTFNNQFSFPIMSSLPLSPAPSMPPPPGQSSITYAEAITRTMNNDAGNNNTSTTAPINKALMPANTSTNTQRKRVTYGTDPRFLEIRQAYHSVITSQAAEEEPLARWVRTVISNTSAIETDPKKVEPVLLGLKELCEENGIPLPLQKVGPCQFQLLGRKNGSGGQKLSVRLINGRLMARSGPAWLDIFKWLERQPLSIEREVERSAG